MALMQVVLDYSSRKLIASLSDDDYSHLSKIVGGNVPGTRDKEGWVGAMSEPGAIVDDCDAEWLTGRGIAFTVKRFKGNVELGKYQLPDGRAHTVHVHIPNIGLLTVDEVDVMEDCCTNTLQDKLNDGWRILAVCPPALQRRPDYILGRTNGRRE